MLRSSQPIRVMSRAVSLPDHTFFSGQAKSSKRLTSTCVHSFTRNVFLESVEGIRGIDKEEYLVITLE